MNDPRTCDIQIQTTEKLARISWNGGEWRTYRFISHLSVVEGKPLFAAGEYTPDDSSVYSSSNRHEVVMWGDERFYGADFIHSILGVVDGKPVYVGSYEEWELQPENKLRLCHGEKQGTFSFSCVAALLDPHVVCNQVPVCTVYRCSGNEYDEYEQPEDKPDWYVLVGGRHCGPFDEIPQVQGKMDSDKPNHPCVAVTVTGTYRSEPRTEAITLKE